MDGIGAAIGGRLQDVLADYLPGMMDAATYEALLEMGCTFGDTKGDLVHVRLPEGWRKERCRENQMQVDIYDPRGTKRVWCLLHPDTRGPRDGTFALWRYVIERDGDTEPSYEKDSAYYVLDRLTGQIVYPHDASKRTSASEATDWLDRTYPGWRQLTAYWDEDLGWRARLWRYVRHTLRTLRLR